MASDECSDSPEPSKPQSANTPPRPVEPPDERLAGGLGSPPRVATNRKHHLGSSSHHSVNSVASSGSGHRMNLITPISTTRRSKNKLSSRLSKFERHSIASGEMLSPMQSLSTHSYQTRRSVDVAALSPLHPPLSATTHRKRSVRNSLKDRLKVFDASSRNSSSEGKVLLSPKEVKDLIRSNSQSSRLSNIVNQYEHLPESKQRERLAHKEQARERQRQALAEAGQFRRQAWEAVRSKFGPTSTTIHLGDASQAAIDVFKDVRATKYDFDGFEPPVFEKTQEQRKLIVNIVETTFCFAEFRKGGKARTDDSLGVLVNAFSIVTVPSGHVLIHRGAADKNDSFFIVEQGTIEIQKDGISVNTAGPAQSFGEQALLYQSPSNVTISVTQSSDGPASTGAQLLSIDQQTFRGILHTYTKLAEAEKRQAILSIGFLGELLQDDDDDGVLNQLVATMTRHECDLNEQFETTEDNTFYIVQRGQMNVTSKSGALDIILHEGDYFGERALIGSLPRRSLVTTVSTMKSCSETGSAFFRIDRHQMEQIIGPSKLENLRDLRRLAAAEFFKQSKLSKALNNSLASNLVEHKLSGEIKEAFQVQKEDNPSLYIVREGTVSVSFTDHNGLPQERSFTTGEVFGHDQIKETKSGGKRIVERLDGLKVFSISDLGASIAVLNLGDLAYDDLSLSGRSTVSRGSKGSIHEKPSVHKRPKTRDSAILELRTKVREAVRSGISVEDFEKISLLGQGEYGEVWLVATDVFKAGGSAPKQQFALKSQRKVDETRGKDALDAIRREIEVMQELSHPQIVDLVHIYEDESSVDMLMGLIPGGEIWDRIHHEDINGTWTSGLPEDDAKFYTLVVADVLGFMHAQKYIFRDLKPENIMIDSDGYPVVVDFGFAKFCPDKTWTFCGTPNYVAPEIITNSGHNRCVDYWALGVTLYEFISGENPFYFDGMEQVALYDAICTEPHYPLGENKSPQLVDLVEKLLTKDPSRRLGMLAGGIDDILQHPWLQELDLNRVRAKRFAAPWKPDTTGLAETELILDHLALSDSGLISFNDSFASFNDSFATIPAIVEGDETQSIDALSPRSESLQDSNRTLEEPPSKVEATKDVVETKPKKEKKKSKRKKKVTAEDFKFVTPTSDVYFPVSNPIRKTSREHKRESSMRKSAISGALAGLGLDDEDDDIDLFLNKK